MRSQNATGAVPVDAEGRAAEGSAELPTPTSKEVLALSAYVTWLANGYNVGSNPSWRGQNTIPNAALIDPHKLDPRKGEAIFLERCTSCHGADGQGVTVGDKRPGPLWGPDSWNDGAGAARIYTLAGIICFTMPYLIRSVSDEDAQLAAFIIRSPARVSVQGPGLPGGKLPVDSVYYAKRNLEYGARK